MESHVEESDFENLAAQDSDFAAALQRNDGIVNFKDPHLLRQLTISLLKRNLGLSLELPDDRLCPPVPVRLSYVRWIQDIITSNVLNESAVSFRRRHLLSSQSVSGLDIGTGASCIYPLLYIANANRGICCIHRNDNADNNKTVSSAKTTEKDFYNNHPEPLTPVTFIASDIDAYSLGWAEKNVALNEELLAKCDSHIDTVHTQVSDPLLLPLSSGDNRIFDFTICNPPFYSSVEEIQRNYEGKVDGPAAVCTGAVSEMIYNPSQGPEDSLKRDISGESDRKSIESGGDIAFALRILLESRESNMRYRVRWYSCMLGKLSSLKSLIGHFEVLGVKNWAACRLQAGNRTRRWAVAWSWGKTRIADNVARRDITIHSLIPLSNEYTIFLDRHLNDKTPRGVSNQHLNVLEAISGVIDDKLRSIDLLRWSWTERHYEIKKSNDANDEKVESEKVLSGIGLTKGNVWSRLARRSKERQEMLRQASSETRTTPLNNPVSSVTSNVGANSSNSNTDDKLGYEIEIASEANFAFRIALHLQTATISGNDNITTTSKGNSIVSNEAKSHIDHQVSRQTCGHEEEIANNETGNGERKVQRDDDEKLEVEKVVVHWIYGHERRLFESFGGMLKRLILESL